MNVSHSFSVEVACIVGDRRATILNNFSHWHLKNGADGHHVIDGYVWTYNSIAAFAKVWPYLTPKQVRVCLDSLEDEGYLKTGNYNEWKSDQTKWYALTEKGCELLKIPFSVELADLPKRANAFAQKGNSNLPNGQMDLPKKADGFAQKGKPLPLLNQLENQIENQLQQGDPEIQNRDVVDDADPAIELIKTQIEKARTSALKSKGLRKSALEQLGISPQHYDRLVNGFYDDEIGFAEAGVAIDLELIQKHLAAWVRKQVNLGPVSRFHPDFKPVSISQNALFNNTITGPTVISRLQSSIPD